MAQQQHAALPTTSVTSLWSSFISTSASWTEKQQSALLICRKECLERRDRSTLFGERWNFESFRDAVEAVNSLMTKLPPPLERPNEQLMHVFEKTVSIICTGNTAKRALLELLYLVHAFEISDIYILVTPYATDTTLHHLSTAFIKNIDLGTLQSIPLVTVDSILATIYLHRGNPRAIDGPNLLNPFQELLYTGSACSKKSVNGGLMGGATRIYSTASGHKSQIQRLRNSSKHYTAFYGTPIKNRPCIVDQSEIDPKRVEPSADPFHQLFVLPLDTPMPIILFIETLVATGFRTIASSPEVVFENAPSWLGLNQEVPSADRFTGGRSTDPVIQRSRGASSVNKTREKIENGTGTWNLASGTSNATELSAKMSKNSKKSTQVIHARQREELLAGTFKTTIYLATKTQAVLSVPTFGAQSNKVYLNKANWEQRSDLPRLVFWKSVEGEEDPRAKATIKFTVDQEEFEFSVHGQKNECLLSFKSTEKSHKLLHPSAFSKILEIGKRLVDFEKSEDSAIIVEPSAKRRKISK